MKSHGLNRWMLAVCALTLTSASLAQSRSASTPASQPAEPSKFLRFVDDGQGGGRLEASVVTYRNPDGATVDLIAAVHIADAKFFRDLDQSFKQYDSLLYEMVKPKDMPNTFPMKRPTTYPTTRAARAAQSMGWVGAMQHFLRDKLDLTFQLEEIDYTRPNFVHADLDVETFEDMQEARGESMMKLMIQQMIHELARDNPPAGAAVQPGVMDIITALQSPDRARQLKLVLAREFGAMDDLMSGLEGPAGGKGTVIVTERNKAAIRTLKQRLQAGDKKIGIFYGAAHLKGMEKMLVDELQFKQVGEPHWHTAWDMSKSKDADRRMKDEK